MIFLSNIKQTIVFFQAKYIQIYFFFFTKKSEKENLLLPSLKLQILEFADILLAILFVIKLSIFYILTCLQLNRHRLDLISLYFVRICTYIHIKSRLILNTITRALLTRWMRSFRPYKYSDGRHCLLFTSRLNQITISLVFSILYWLDGTKAEIQADFLVLDRVKCKWGYVTVFWKESNSKPTVCIMNLNYCFFFL